MITYLSTYPNLLTFPYLLTYPAKHITHLSTDLNHLPASRYHPSLVYCSLASTPASLESIALPQARLQSLTTPSVDEWRPCQHKSSLEKLVTVNWYEGERAGRESCKKP